jgi:hypothetical protein
MPFNEQLRHTSFNIEKELAKLPLAIKSDSAQYDSLLESLKSGKSKEVTFLINDKPVKYTLEASPHRNTIDVLYKNGDLVDIDKLFSCQINQVARQIIENQQQKEELIDMGQAQGLKYR